MDYFKNGLVLHVKYRHLIIYQNCILFFYTQNPQSGSTDKKMKLFTSGSASLKATINKMGYMKGQLMSLQNPALQEKLTKEVTAVCSC